MTGTVTAPPVSSFVAPGYSLGCQYPGFPGIFVATISNSVRLDLALIQAVPVEVQRQQLEDRLGELQSADLLSRDEVATLLSTAEGARPDTPVPLHNPDGSPSLCGFLSAAMTPKTTTDASHLSLALAAAGGAAVGGMLGGPAGAIIGAGLAVLCAD
ncbi:hypothetical protein [Streptomyces sioyaensis]|uniref:hypothetical protein n=1 Tax=Streptomyces sioyaensis TaxID=67364 RepID=UPI0036E6B604